MPASQLVVLVQLNVYSGNQEIIQEIIWQANIPPQHLFHSNALAGYIILNHNH